MVKNTHAILINVGSPASPSRGAVKRFLKSFLMDRYVLQIAWIARLILVNAIIVPLRAGRVAKKYRTIWRGLNSPIIDNTQRLVAKIERTVVSKSSGATISYAMRHGEDSINKEFILLSKLGVENVLVIPQYPQFDKSTYQSAMNAVNVAAKRRGIGISVVTPFFDDEGYIDALEHSIKEALDLNTVDQLIYSFHSLPLKNLPCDISSKCDLSRHDGENAPTELCSDCYKYQCYTTARMVSERLNLANNNYQVLFQSNIGMGEWISPALDTTLAQLPQKGVKRVAVVAPSFTADCLETLSEIDIEGREIFMSSGGREFTYIPALNDNDLWVKQLVKWIMECDALIERQQED